MNNMRENFDYIAFATELKEIADSIADHEENKYEDNLKRAQELLEDLFENVLRPILSEEDFVAPADLKMVARVFNYINSIFDSPREKLILSLGESLVYETFCSLLDADNKTKE